MYNKVAALNADIFDLELDRTLSPTGHRLACDKCEIYTDDYGLERYRAKYVDECCNQAKVQEILNNPEPYKDTLFKQVTIEDVPDFCSCACGGDETCYGCSMYFEQLTVEKPTIILIKENIATWYYIIRMLAMAIMLVVLIAVGIKMALSTVASDKAVYKRMLVDWVVGVIMLFTLHYFMVFVININAIAVGLVEETAQSVNQASLKQASEDLKMDLHDELHTKDLEIRVYEEIRTRAYDAKLSNGIIGMVMYMAMVFMAVKYTFIYLKRLLTIMVLTLMAPGVGVAYALQKVLTGKSQALKTWMTEYIMNVIIQIIHALIYAIFISQAFILSLTNIAGMIVALVFLNYAAKAEETFKKIFKFGGKDSLVGHTDGAMESMAENINAAKGLVMGAKPAAKMLTNTPYGKAVKGLGKAAIAGGAVAGKKYLDSREERKEKKENDKYNKAWDKEYEKVEAEYASRTRRSDEDAEKEEMQKIVEKRLEAKGILKPVPRTHKDAIKRTLEEREKTQEEFDENLVQLADAHTELKNQNQNENPQEETQGIMDGKTEDAQKQKAESEDKKQKLTAATRLTRDEAAKRYVENIFNIDNYFRLSKTNGLFDFKGHAKNAGIISDGIYGTQNFDPIKMKYVSNNDAVYQKLFSEQMFGLTKDDKKMFKDHVMPLIKGVTGMGAVFVGMGTIVTNPKLGMGLLATGTAGIKGATKKKYSIKKCAGRYDFVRFESGAIRTIGKNAVKQARKERRHQRAESIKTRRADFAAKFRSGDIKAVTLGVAAGVAAGPIMPVVFAYKGAKAMFHPKETYGKIKHTGQEVANMIKNPGETIGNVASTTATFGKGLFTSTAAGITNTGKKAAETGKKSYKAIRGLGGSYDPERSTTVKSFMGDKIKEGKEAGEKAGKYVTGKFKRVLSGNEHYAALFDYREKKMKEFEDKLMEETLNIAGQQTQDIFKDTYTEESKTLGESDKAVEQRIETAAMLGYDYDQKSNQMTRKETVSAEDIDETRLANVDFGGKPSQRVLDEALDKVLERYSQKGKIDLSSKGLQDKVIKEINTELVSSKIIQTGETVESVFKGGRTGLVKVMKGKAGKIEDQAKTEADLRKVLSHDQIGKIDEAIKGAKKGASITDILAGVSGIVDSSKDGSAKVSEADGTRRVDMGNAGDRAVNFGGGDSTQKLVRSYIAARHSTPKTTEYVRSKKKVAQVMEALLPDMPNTDEANQQTKPQVDILELISQVNSIAKDPSKESGTITIGGEEVVLLAREAKSMKKVLPRYYEMTEVNRDAMQLDISKASSEYKKVKKEKQSLDTRISQLEGQIKQLDDISSGGNTGNGSRNDSQRPYSKNKEAFKKLLNDKQTQRSELETRAVTMGPIVPIGDVVRKINGTDGSRRVVDKTRNVNISDGNPNRKNNGTGGGKK